MIDEDTYEPDTIKEFVRLHVSNPSKILFEIPISMMDHANAKSCRLSSKVTLLLPSVGSSLSNPKDSDILARFTKQIDVTATFDETCRGELFVIFS